MNEHALAVDNLSPERDTLDRRGRLIACCMIAGFSIPALCWLAVLCGATRAVFPHDQVAVLGVLLSVYAPLFAFMNNPRERRSLEKQLIHFAWLVFFSNVGYQFFWEMPWFVLKEQIYAIELTEADRWFWPWWAYGVADTRYLKPNELAISISGMDASVALLEVFIVVMYYRGYRILAAWFALIMGSCMGWGQYYFYMGEIYFHFVNIEDGWFGFWFKYMILNLPWLIFPFIAGAGFIWHLASHYKNIGVQEYLARQSGLTQRSEGSDFHRDTYIFSRSSEEADLITPVNHRDFEFEQHSDIQRLKPMIYFAFSTPLIFLAIDIARFYR